MNYNLDKAACCNRCHFIAVAWLVLVICSAECSVPMSDINMADWLGRIAARPIMCLLSGWAWWLDAQVQVLLACLPTP